MKLEIEVEIKDGLPKNVKIGNWIISFWDGSSSRYVGEQIYKALVDQMPHTPSEHEDNDE